MRYHPRRFAKGIVILAALVFLTRASTAQDQPSRAADADRVEKRAVVIWSDGTRMAGDLYLPRGAAKDAKLPAVIFCNGTGGTKRGVPERVAPRFVAAGFAFLAFDYRGWGESDARLMTVDAKQPPPDEHGEITVRAKTIRWQMDFADQTADVRSAIAFVAGEPQVDAERIGLLGTSYGGGIVTWVAGNDPRVKCVVAQVPGMGGGRGPAAERRAYELLSKQSRGETEPVPLETGKLGGALAQYAQMRSNPAKGIGYSAIAAAEKVTAPMLIVAAEKDELLDNRLNGQKVYELLRARDVPAEYHVIEGITHYGVYREAFEDATKREIAWFERFLGKAAAVPR
jgi:dipeptidyl aminopeptidase/acylaminoacyl peptidase